MNRNNRRSAFPGFGELVRLVVTGFLLCLGAASRAATAQETYGYVYTPTAPSQDTPRILKVEMNSDDLRARGPIAIRVTTTPDVVTVVTGRGPWSGTLHQEAPGIFTSAAILPTVHLPFGGAHIKIHFAATTASGQGITADVPVTYH